MKTIITLDRANQPYGYPQLDGSGSLRATGSLFGTASYASTAPDSRPYKVYTALLTQTSTSAPVATVLENTIGNITYMYDGPGYYFISSSGAFTLNKSTVILGALIDNGDYSTPGYYTARFYDGTNTPSTSTIELRTNGYGPAAANNCLYETPIEIRVYN